ncbi:protein of unknown function [Rhodovastum atsumiense]|nr:protein of unknown function [Rhodovastum atsumiense]
MPGRSGRCSIRAVSDCRADGKAICHRPPKTVSLKTTRIHRNRSSHEIQKRSRRHFDMTEECDIYRKYITAKLTIYRRLVTDNY